MVHLKETEAAAEEEQTGKETLLADKKKK